jgi:hypothetical protein
LEAVAVDELETLEVTGAAEVGALVISVSAAEVVSVSASDTDVARVVAGAVVAGAVVAFVFTGESPKAAVEDAAVATAVPAAAALVWESR